MNLEINKKINFIIVTIIMILSFVVVGPIFAANISDIELKNFVSSFADTNNLSRAELENLARSRLKGEYGYSGERIDGIFNGNGKLPPVESKETTAEKLKRLNDANKSSGANNTNGNSGGKGGTFSGGGTSGSFDSGFVPLDQGFFNALSNEVKGDVTKDTSLFFNAVFKFGIYIAGFLATIMIAIGGITYMSSDAINDKKQGKEIITSALAGLLLILFSWILLNQINPDLLNLKI